MADEHARYERLAVGHVVGGLDEVDAARFRTHLVQCRHCRSRVAELRGIANELTATEREERAARASSGTTELAAREETEAPPRAADVAPARSWPWRVVAVALLPLLVLGGLAWAVWIRAEVDLTAAALGTSNRALRIIAEGEQLTLRPTTTATELRGVVAATADEVVVDLSGLPALGPDEAARVVLLDATGEVVVEGTVHTQTRLAEAWLFDVLRRSGTATDVSVRIERFDGTELSLVQELATAPLPSSPSELISVGDDGA